jgi:hypothetical protein
MWAAAFVVELTDRVKALRRAIQRLQYRKVVCSEQLRCEPF